MKILVIVLSFLTSISSCRKQSSQFRYYGEVIAQPNYCTSSKGYPFIIKYSKNNTTDTVITITLPIQYKFIGQKIKFEMRELNFQDERIACTSLFIIPQQVVICNVSQQ